uniref:NADH dehydrogenase [ubiquinone] iron-sulfur protein 6, mitochondrial n=1 Tax=Neovison vison TaxID=452646 RepID=A0A8C7CE77_NEOVI
CVRVLDQCSFQILPHAGRGCIPMDRTCRPTLQNEVYDDADYRRVRFVGRQKEVNENFAIDLIAEQPVSEVGNRVIACDGGGGALGHPKVYINLDKETKTGTCGYCGLQFRQHQH